MTTAVPLLWSILLLLPRISTAGHHVPEGSARGRFTALDSLVVRAIADSAFPGAQLLIGGKEEILHAGCYGRYTYEHDSPPVTPSTLFDLASLTKVIATTAAVMKLVDGGRLSLDDPASTHIPRFSGGEKGKVTIRMLLTHRSGLPPFRRFYSFCPTPEAALDSLLATPLVARPGDTTIYSDLGMILLGMVVERAGGMGLDDFAAREVYGPLRMENTMFNPPAGRRSSVAPTELDTIWRHRLVQGTVHDENAAFLGGVCGHAGLFSNADDLSRFMQMLLGRGARGERRILRPETVDLFLTPAPGVDRLLGWQGKSPHGSSAGERFSAQSYGHTGFTGTSIWADPERGVFVIFLTNRVYPTRANGKIDEVRRQLHDAAINCLEGAGREVVR